MKHLNAFVIDHDPRCLSIFTRVLQQRGHQVHLFESPGKTPFLKSEGCPCPIQEYGCPDVIITDYNMPGLNGLEFLEAIVNKGCLCRHLALITDSGLMEWNFHKASNHGTRYFTKPLNFDDFYDWLDHVEAQVFANRYPAPVPSPSNPFACSPHCLQSQA